MEFCQGRQQGDEHNGETALQCGGEELSSFRYWVWPLLCLAISCTRCLRRQRTRRNWRNVHQEVCPFSIHLCQQF
ncbi:hypothetical protein AGIG_G19817 [Arapaima gigas]